MMVKLIHPKNLLFLILAAALLAACSPNPDALVPTQALSLPQDTLTLDPATTSNMETAPVVTPRGPDLVATDPATVNLASGQLQLVEFFRFT
jgi:hypothetical protein